MNRGLHLPRVGVLESVSCGEVCVVNHHVGVHDLIGVVVVEHGGALVVVPVLADPGPRQLPQLWERHLVFRVGGDDEVHVCSRALAAPWGVVAVGDAGEVHLGRPVDVLLQIGVELRVSLLVPREVVQVDGQGAAVLLEVVGDAANAGVPGYGFYNGHASHRLRSWSRLCPSARTRSPGGPARLLRASPRLLTASGRTCRTQAGSLSG